MAVENGTDDTAAAAAALLEFLGTFPTLSGAPPQALSDLADGVALFEALAELAPDHFDPASIARHLGDNWALKSSNLRRLVRGLGDYFRSALGRDAAAVLDPLDVLALAQKPDEHADQLAALLGLLAAAAVTCPEKATYVGRILQMSPEGQVQMKTVLQSRLGQLPTYTPDPEDEWDDEEEEKDGADGTGADFDGDGGGGDQGELVFGQDEYHDADGAAPRNLFGSGARHHLVAGASPIPSAAAGGRLEEALEQAQRQVAALKSQLQLQEQDHDRAQEKLRAVVEDLQGRLVQRQDELIQVEEDLQKAVAELEDTKGRLVDAREESTRLADDLDIAQAKAQQLARVEASLEIYKKKYEQVGGMTQQMRDAEDQSANYLQQIMEIEAQVRRSATAQKQVEQLSEQIRRLEKERDTLVLQQKSSVNEIDDIKSQLKAANASKRSLGEELAELRAKHEAVEHAVHTIPTAPQARGLDDDLKQEFQSKVSRLEAENEVLRQEMQKLKLGNGGGSDVAEAVAQLPAVASVPKEDVEALHQKIKQLEEEVAQKEAVNKKIVGDKDKLEAYTKRTLAKFQDKYLVALTECKSKLKEKQDKIEALEQRSTAERTAQKREERLLSSTIYELGMAIMQSRLKDR